MENPRSFKHINMNTLPAEEKQRSILDERSLIERMVGEIRSKDEVTRTKIPSVHRQCHVSPLYGTVLHRTDQGNRKHVDPSPTCNGSFAGTRENSQLLGLGNFSKMVLFGWSLEVLREVPKSEKFP